MDHILKSLLEKEEALRKELERITPIFKQWEGLKSTIKLFQKSSPIEPIAVLNSNKRIEIPDKYSVDDMTWKQKVLFMVKKLGRASVEQIVTEISKVDKSLEGEALDKRIGITASKLKVEDKELGADMEGRKGIYYLI